jgi:hypothetical protein
MDYYNYSVDLPYTKCKIDFREINTQEQLLIAKANLSFSNNKDSLYDYHKFILSVILNCVKDKEEFYKINIIEYVLFLVKLRSISVGSTIEFLLKDENKAKTKIQINLKSYLLNLYNASNYFEDKNNSILTEKSIELKLNWPNINSVSTFNNLLLNEKKEYYVFNNSLFEFIEYIKINDNKILWNNLNTEEKLKLFDKFPIILKNKMEKNIIDAIKKLIESDMFDVSFFKDYKFSIYNLNFVEHIKMFLSYDLKSLFTEIYYLAVSKLPPNYVLTISDSERKMFMTIIQEQNKKQEDNSSSVAPEDSIGFSGAVKDLAVEFGQDLSK